MNAAEFYLMCCKEADLQGQMPLRHRPAVTFDLGPYEAKFSSHDWGTILKVVIGNHKIIVVSHIGGATSWLSEPSPSEIVKLRLYL